jgi:hypothetical protein
MQAVHVDGPTHLLGAVVQAVITNAEPHGLAGRLDLDSDDTVATTRVVA